MQAKAICHVICFHIIYINKQLIALYYLLPINVYFSKSISTQK